MMLQCPFCGGQNLRKSQGEIGKVYWITCMDCRACGPFALNDTDEAQELWNNRVVDKWIEPKEMMPPPLRKVLVAYRNSWDKLRRTTAEHVPHRYLLAEDYYDVDYTDVDIDVHGVAWVLPGWYEVSEQSEDNLKIVEEVTHWIYLPKLPEE